MSAYYRSFPWTATEEYTRQFLEDGFVVVDNVLSSDEISKSVDEVWSDLSSRGSVQRNDVSSWTNENWPPEICRNGGTMDGLCDDPSTLLPCFWNLTLVSRFHGSLSLHAPAVQVGRNSAQPTTTGVAESGKSKDIRSLQEYFEYRKALGLH